MLNELNFYLQGKDKTIVDMIIVVQAFKQKLKLVSSQLQQHALRNFRTGNQGKQYGQFNSDRYRYKPLSQNLIDIFRI